MSERERLTAAGRAAPRVLRLPEIGESQAPGWRVVRHSVGMLIGIFVAAVAGALILAMFVGMRVTIDGDGDIEPLEVWPLRSLESGTLAEVLVHTGDTVKAGQVVIRLDTLATSTTVRETMAQLIAAETEARRLQSSAPLDSARARTSIVQQEARVATARTALRERMVAFGVKGDVDSVARASAARVHVGLDAPAADYAAAQAGAQISRLDFLSLGLSTFKLEQQKAEIRRLTSELTTARARLARQSLHAPADGVVLTDEVEKLVGSAVSSGQSILEIGDTRQWQAVLHVSERDVHRIKIGDQAIIELPALSMMRADEVHGTVSLVGWQVAAQGGSQSPVGGGFRVTVKIDSSAVAGFPPHVFRRGYAARGKIVTRSARAIEIMFETLRDRIRRAAND